MNKSVIMCLFALCLTFQAQAQRYLPGQKGVQITAGTVNGFTLDQSNPNFLFVGIIQHFEGSRN